MSRRRADSLIWTAVIIVTSTVFVTALLIGVAKAIHPDAGVNNAVTGAGIVAGLALSLLISLLLG